MVVFSDIIMDDGFYQPKDVVNPNEIEIEKLMKEYDLDNPTYEKISALLLKDIEKGLGKKTHAEASVKCFPTYVQTLPDGSENGNFLSLDLGGTNFRVLLIVLKGNEVEMKNKIYPIAQKLMLGKGVDLFDHIANCIADFMKEQNIVDQKLPLGFTFSFPCKQESLARGRLVTWTKGFQCEGVEGEDVVKLLHDAIHRRSDIDVRCVALLNDTVGCLMSCAFLDHDTEIGVILGTGTNACYMEKLDKVELWDGDDKEPRQVIINTEWGAFGDDGALDFIRTDVDRDIDSTTLNPGRHKYEKMISGMYMGEIARQCVVKCVKQGLLLGGKLTDDLNTKDKFYTKYVSEIEKDSESDGYTNTKEVLDELGYENPSDEDCKSVLYICALVSRRAAFLASAGIACLLNRINKPAVTVAVDGSLYRFHPHFHNLMVEKIQQLLKPGLTFKLTLSVDGSGRGAAFVAAVLDKIQREEQEANR